MLQMPAAADRINWMNIGLMIGAWTAAVFVPFHVFLFAYAVLGPLHYLTEISWLHDRDFFTKRPRSRRTWLLLVAVTVSVMVAGYISSDVLMRPVGPKLEIGMFLLVFLAAAVALYVRHPVNAGALLILSASALLVFSAQPLYGVLAYLLITVVHVFVFTGCFILYGAVKTQSQSGYLSFVVFLICAAAAFLVSGPFKAPDDQLRIVYGGFEELNRILLRFAGRPPDGVYNSQGVGVMRFIAFAYTYHYLNWFSKTSIIRWHEVSVLRALAIAGGWVAAVGLYLYSYRVGFAALYVLSVMHVMLEFPLNHQSFVGLAQALVPVNRTVTAR